MFQQFKQLIITPDRNCNMLWENVITIENTLLAPNWQSQSLSLVKFRVLERSQT